MKNKLILISTMLISLGLSTSAFSHNEANEALTHAVKRANFMPTLMMHTLKNADALALTDAQKSELKAYQMKNSPNQQDDMKEVVRLEMAAAQAGLSKDLSAAKLAGDQSIVLRQSIFNQKLECYKKIQSILTTEQFEQLKSMLPK